VSFASKSIHHTTQSTSLQGTGNLCPLASVITLEISRTSQMILVSGTREADSSEKESGVAVISFFELSK
jgi:hypothetical protein